MDGIEGLTKDQYDSWSYYERWTAAMVTLLMDHRRGVIARDELEAALFGEDLVHANAPPDRTAQPLFGVGDYVRVKAYQPMGSDNTQSSLSRVEWKRPHLRTPGYIYGVAGEVEHVCGRHSDPSLLAYGIVGSTPTVQLYRVRFHQRDVWPEQYPGNTAETTDDFVEVEVYEHWLEPTRTNRGHSFQEEVLQCCIVFVPLLMQLIQFSNWL